MNYFAHGIRFLDRPWFLAGTAVPDWLGVADRKVRLRPNLVAPFADGSGSAQAELAAGVLQHLEDDRWFHGTPAFAETSAALADLFRRELGADNGFRPGFLGHIVTELLLDGLLAEKAPGKLDDYFRGLGQVDPRVVEQTVNRMAPKTTDRLAWFVDRFLEVEFLRDYEEPARLRTRLNQVLGRVRLRPLPEAIETLLEEGRALVRGRMEHLLPEGSLAETAGQDLGAS